MPPSSPRSAPLLMPGPDVGGRNCGNCACYFEMAHPLNALERQGFCRRFSVNAQAMRVQVPRVDEHGAPIVSKLDKRPVVDVREEVLYVNAVTAAQLVCFDGWRPVGSLPGESLNDSNLRRSAELLSPILEASLAQVPDDAPAGLANAVRQVLTIFRGELPSEPPTVAPAPANDASAEAPAQAPPADAPRH